MKIQVLRKLKLIIKEKIESQVRFRNNKKVKTSENIYMSSVEENIIRTSLINKNDDVLIVSEDNFDHNYFKF